MEPAKNENLETHVDEQPVNVITFIHGTAGFLRLREPNEWCDTGSPLRETLQDKFPTAKFEVFSWSGENNHIDRQKAAVALRAQLHEQVRENPYATQVLIAHSHGGNIALNALSDRFLQTKVRTVFCLSTPFFVPLRRPSSMFFGSILGMSVAIGIPTIFLFMVLFNLIILSMAALNEWREPLLYTSLLLGSAFLLYGGVRLLIWLMPLLVFVTKDLVQKIDRKIDLSIQNMKYPEFDDDTTIVCLWARGDEIYEAFSVLGIIANSAYNLLRPLLLLNNVYSFNIHATL